MAAVATATHLLSFTIRPRFRRPVSRQLRPSHDRGALFQSSVLTVSCHARRESCAVDDRGAGEWLVGRHVQAVGYDYRPTMRSARCRFIALVDG